VTVLEPSAVDAVLAQGLAWERAGAELVKVRRGRDFADSLDFVNKVGALAEEANHHPDVDIRWNVVTLHLATHSAGGITAADLALARRIDELASGTGASGTGASGTGASGTGASGTGTSRSG
jgi:4a-hydroxytetrahydrobiopterin dehydratase